MECLRNERTISGCHLNPAVSLGLAVGGRFAWKDVLPYWAGQVLGAIAGAGLLFIIASGTPGFELGGFASNGFAEHSPGNYTMMAALVTEVAMTFFFLFVVLGSTSDKASAGFAPLAIGLCLTLIHLVSIPVTNTSVNPARSTGPAIIVGGWAIKQLWLFWLAPLAGAALAGIIYPIVSDER